MIALDITLTISSYYMDFGPTLPITIVYLVISTAFLIFYIVTAVQISKRMRDAQKIRKVSRLNRVSIERSMLLVAYQIRLDVGRTLDFQ